MLNIIMRGPIDRFVSVTAATVLIYHKAFFFKIVDHLQSVHNVTQGLFLNLFYDDCSGSFRH